ncbi:cardiolipin synthase B [Thauera humireducens]|uniref:Cardiolipin synthase B n=1 Tax=Thauera humireducens TaxID=1134435 RepID=A0A127KAX7_9RHOO|nr:cardiolipin synthase ClsB [Thauera humireducens]AMO39112.1 cardiolipin synthase B [Thauera humireducens]
MPSPLPGNALTLLENGEQYFPALRAAIDGAEREIFLQTYIFEPDETGRSVADALERAAARGVEVRVMVDGFGGRSFVAQLMPRMIERGVQVLIYRRELRPLSLRRHRLRRLHRKVVVIDGREAFVGGINIIDDYEHGAAVPHPRFDYAVQVRGPVLEQIVASVHRLWRLVVWASFRRRQHAPLIAPAQTAVVGDIRAAFVVRDNLRFRHAIEDAYLSAIGRARHEIVIANAYFFPGRRFRQALTDAAARGVRITLLLQGVADHPMQRYATRALYSYFLARGIRLFEYHRSHLHAKVAVVDGYWTTVGSSNIDAFSLLLAREANVVIEDSAFARQLRDSLERAICSGATELRPADWQRLSLLQRALNWVSYQLVRLAIGLAGYGGKH